MVYFTMFRLSIYRNIYRLNHRGGDDEALNSLVRLVVI